ncbi:MAG: MerR family transcriptional regulator [Rhodospirillales bacterium]|nr:MerR family transcriptional regulator [Rhodospirillales bacterium]
MAAPAEGPSAGGRAAKSAAAFRTISEVASELKLPQHVLRFWESKFTAIRPMKRGGGRRYYRPEDVALLTCIRDLLHNDGYTIKGVQKLLRESGGKLKAAPVAAAGSDAQAPVPVPAPAEGDRFTAETRAQLKSLLGELEDLRATLGGI